MALAGLIIAAQRSLDWVVILPMGLVTSPSAASHCSLFSEGSMTAAATAATEQRFLAWASVQECHLSRHCVLRRLRVVVSQSSVNGGPSSVMSYFSKTAATTARSGIPFRVNGPSSS